MPQAAITTQGAPFQIRSGSFSANPAQYDTVFRTDIGLQFYYDGTRWLTVTKYIIAFPFLSALSGSNFASQVATYQDLDMWLEKVIYSTFVATTNTGAAFWTIEASKSDTNAASTSFGTVSTAADSANVRSIKAITINAALGTAAVYPILFNGATKTGSPGTLDYGASLVYRLIGT